jgi:hypothetical protein
MYISSSGVSLCFLVVGDLLGTVVGNSVGNSVTVVVVSSELSSELLSEAYVGLKSTNTTKLFKGEKLLNIVA